MFISADNIAEKLKKHYFIEVTGEQVSMPPESNPIQRLGEYMIRVTIPRLVKPNDPLSGVIDFKLTVRKR